MTVTLIFNEPIAHTTHRIVVDRMQRTTKYTYQRSVILQDGSIDDVRNLLFSIDPGHHPEYIVLIGDREYIASKWIDSMMS